MSSRYATLTLGVLTLQVQWPLTWTPPVRSVNVVSNALSSAPLQVTDYISDFGQVAGRIRLKGIDTLSESAADHLERQMHNLEAVIASDSSLFSVHMSGASTTRTVQVYKSDPPVRVDDWVVDRLHYRFVDFTLRYLDL